MTNANYHKVRFMSAVAFLLVMVISSTIFFYVQGKSGKTSSNSKSAVSPTARKATPEPTPTILTTPQPLFFDNFTDKSKGWYLGNTSGYSRVISGDSLTLADSNHT